MQRIAAENRLSETAFFVPDDDAYQIRWFTPASEVDLCGHATLATAYVLFHHLDYEPEVVLFRSQSGDLPVRRLGESMVLDFPSRPPAACNIPEALETGLRRSLHEVYRSRDHMVVFKTEEEVRSIEPDFEALAELDTEGVIITAPGDDVDFVSRFFAPKLGIPEDPVTGSAHCTLAPYWARVLGKNDLAARQVSDRGGELACRVVEDRVQIAGRAALYAKGFLNVE
jgi:predicted PhzF superfamily epimerase YddE/YHI9